MKSKMNSTKTTTLIISILVLFAMNLSAQMNRSSSQNDSPVYRKQMQGPKNIEEEVAILTQELSLSEEQAVQVTELFTEHVEEVDKLHESNSADQSVDRSQMQKLRKEFEDKVIEILDEEQQQQFKELNKKQQPDRPQRGNRGK